MFLNLFKNKTRKIFFVLFCLFFVTNLDAKEINLTLYYRPNCFYCVKVLNELKKNNIQIPMKDISTNPAYVNELVKIGGKKQIPCLVIDGKAMYESGTIIHWIDAHKDELH